MDRLKILFVLAAAFCWAIGLPTTGLAQEHPTQQTPKAEHPKPKQEHPKPEHPTAKPVSTAALEAAIKDQIAEKAKASGGKFPVRDDVLDKTWQLKLVRVHTDKLTQLDDKTYFACVDFKADDGTLIDADFYMKNDNGKLTLSDTAIHKVNGKPRYTYEKRDDFWVRVPVND